MMLEQLRFNLECGRERKRSSNNHTQTTSKTSIHQSDRFEFPIYVPLMNSSNCPIGYQEFGVAEIAEVASKSKTL
jgi:hypothetical protein